LVLDDLIFRETDFQEFAFDIKVMEVDQDLNGLANIFHLNKKALLLSFEHQELLNPSRFSKQLSVKLFLLILAQVAQVQDRGRRGNISKVLATCYLIAMLTRLAIISQEFVGFRDVRSVDDNGVFGDGNKDVVTHQRTVVEVSFGKHSLGVVLEFDQSIFGL